MVYAGINRLPLDSEALVVNEDGSGYVGDEYGAHVYYFNASKQIVGAIVPPAALLPHKPAGTLNFGSVSAPTNGRATLMPALDPDHPNDYFLFVGSDNDFLTSVGTIQGPDGSLVAYDGFNGYSLNRQPAHAGDGSVNANDTMFLVFRVTNIFDTVAPTFSGPCVLWPPNHQMVTVGTVTASDSLSGVAPGSFSVQATSSDGSPDDVAVTPDGHGGFVVQFRATRAGNDAARTYTITTTARDLVGNVAVQQTNCVVPHDQRGSSE